MKPLGPTGKQWLKTSHLTLSIIWLGGALSMNLLRLAWNPTAPGDLYAVDHAILLIDNWVIIPSSLGALLTGLLESWLTTWGFFKFRWVTAKWIVTVGVMLYGIFFISRWGKAIEAISRVEGLAALLNPTYLQYRLIYSISAVVLIVALTALSVISTLKPWMKQERLKRATAVTSIKSAP